MKVVAQVIGGELKEFTLSEGATVADLKKAEPKFANYQATVNGDSAEDSEELYGYAVVTFSEKVKGAAAHHN